MIFHALLLVGAAVGHVSARSSMPDLALQPNLFPLETTGGCSYQVLLAAVASHCHDNCNAAAALLTLLPQVASVDALPVAVGQACARAWATVDRSSWRDVNFRLDDDFLQGFVDGDTFLNRKSTCLTAPAQCRLDSHTYMYMYAYTRTNNNNNINNNTQGRRAISKKTRSSSTRRVLCPAPSPWTFAAFTRAASKSPYWKAFPP
jgi:hypothetical protein